MKKIIPMTMTLFVLASCGKAKDMPRFPGMEMSPLTVETPMVSEDIEVRVTRFNDLMPDFSNYELFKQNLNYHSINFIPKKGSLLGFSAECKEGDVTTSYPSLMFDKELGVLNYLGSKGLRPVELNCVLKKNSVEIKKTVTVKKSLLVATLPETELDLDVLVIENLTAETEGKDISIKANRIVSMNGRISPAALTHKSTTGLPQNGGHLQIETGEILGDLKIDLVGSEEQGSIKAGEAGTLTLKVPSLDGVRLLVENIQRSTIEFTKTGEVKDIESWPEEIE